MLLFSLVLASGNCFKGMWYSVYMKWEHRISEQFNPYIHLFKLKEVLMDTEYTSKRISCKLLYLLPAMQLFGN